MKAKLLGYITKSQHKDAHTDEWQDFDEGEVQYIFFVLYNNKVYTFTFTYSYGSCGSGYTSASWGYSDTKLVEVDNINQDISELPIIKPIKDIFVTIIYNSVQKSIIDSENSWDATTTTVKSTDDDIIISETGNGGCEYYSSGEVTINNDLFIN